MTNPLTPATIVSYDPALHAGSETKLRVGPQNGGSTALTTVTISDATLAAGDTTITVAAITSGSLLPGTAVVPTGGTLDFAGATVTLTAPAEVGDTSLAVTALTSGNIPANGVSATYSLFPYMPLLSTVNYQPKGTIQSIPLFGTNWDVAVKTGINGTLEIETLAGAYDPRTKSLIVAGYAVGVGARRSFILDNPDGSLAHGFGVVGEASPMYNNRQVYGYKLPVTTTGEWAFLTPTAAPV